MRRGVTLVELMISMLILAIVCIAWLQIIGIQSARKEARRREAVERLAGMMDAFMYDSRDGNINGEDVALKSYYVDSSELEKRNLFLFRTDSEDGGSLGHPMFNDSPISYQLRVVSKKDLPGRTSFDGWDYCYWLIGRLYDKSGLILEGEKPFFTLQVCLGYKP